MTDTSSRAGGAAPANLLAGNEYNPTLRATTAFPVAVPPGIVVVSTPAQAGAVVPGLANALATSSIVGLASATGVVGDRVVVQTHGVLTLPAAEWDAVLKTHGPASGLQSGRVYFLATDQTGHLTTVAPSAPGTVVAQLGLALSATDLLIRICAPELIPPQ